MLATWPMSSGINFVGQLAPLAWYRYGLGITSSGGLVSQWDDQSGNANHLVQATGTNQPSHEADGSILCDGVDNFMTATIATIAQPFSIYMLLTRISAINLSRIFSADGGAMGLQYVAETINSYAGLFPTDGPTVSAVGTVEIYSVVFNGASSVTQVNNDTPVTQNPSTGALTNFNLGSNNGGTNFANCAYKEVLLYSGAHDADQRYRIGRYLAHVGGIAL